METLRTLRILSSLDLTNNRVQYVPNNAFVTLRWIMQSQLSNIPNKNVIISSSVFIITKLKVGG